MRPDPVASERESDAADDDAASDAELVALVSDAVGDDARRRFTPAAGVHCAH